MKNFAFDIIYLPTNKDLNSDFYSEESNNIILKNYLLYRDIDIDLMYLYSDKQNDRMGFDFSTNLKTNFEIHAEVAKEIIEEYAYLLGLKYLTENELTIIMEYFEDFQKYFFTKVTQKEPFDIVYSAVYYKNILNIDDHSHLDSIGLIYDFRNNFEVDISYNQNFGSNTSEFGSKLSEQFVWSRVNWYF